MQAPGKPAAPSAPLVALKFLEGNWTPEATLWTRYGLAAAALTQGYSCSARHKMQWSR